MRPRRFVPEARAAMVAALGEVGNASVGPCRGQERRRQRSRRRAAPWPGCVGGDAKLVTFTGGGTEANNTVLTPRLELSRPSRTAPISFWSRRSSSSPCWPAGVSTRRRCGRSRSMATAVLQARRAREDAGRPCRRGGAAAGLGDARQQRDRRDPAGGRDRRHGARRRRASSSTDAIAGRGPHSRSISPPSASMCLTPVRRTRSAARRGLAPSCGRMSDLTLRAAAASAAARRSGSGREPRTLPPSPALAQPPRPRRWIRLRQRCGRGGATPSRRPYRRQVFRRRSSGRSAAVAADAVHRHCRESRPRRW